MIHKKKSVTPKVHYHLLIQKEPTPNYLDYLTPRSSTILLPPLFRNFCSHKSLSTSFRPLSLGLPTYLLLSGLLSKIFLVTLVCSMLVTCPSYSSPMLLMPTAGSKVLSNNFCTIPHFVVGSESSNPLLSYWSTSLSHTFNITLPFSFMHCVHTVT